MLKKLAVAVVAFAVAGCAGTLPPTSPADAVVVLSQFGVPVRSSFTNDPVTGRDWNCRGCYR